MIPRKPGLSVPAFDLQYCSQKRLEMLQLLSHSQQQDTDDDNADKDISLPVELFFQEDAGQQQGNNANRGEDGGGDGVLTTQSVNIGELAGSFEDSSQDLILVLRNRAKLDLLGLHEDKQTQSKQGEGQLIAGICDGLDSLFCDIHQGRGSHILDQEECVVQEGAEGIQQGVNKGHAESDNGQNLTQPLLSGGLTMIFDEADAQNTNSNDGDGNPSQSGNLFLQENHEQQGADDTGGVFDGVRDGLFQETHTEVGEGHGNDVEQGDRQISQQVHGIIVDILRQQGEDSMSAHVLLQN